MRLRACHHIFFALLLILIFTGTIHAEDEQPAIEIAKPHFNIGLLTDGPIVNEANIIKTFQKEIRNIAEEEYSVSFPKSMTRRADGTVRGVNRQLDRLLNNPATNLIITLGPISSNEAIKRTDPNTPIIAPVVMDAAMQKAPKNDLGSGVYNLTYVDIDIPLEAELMSFLKLVDFQDSGNPC